MATPGRSSTPATVQLSDAGVDFVVHSFDASRSSLEGYGLAAAEALGVEPERVFKTLIVLLDGSPVVAVVPVSGHLSLRHLAAVAGGKRAEMCPPARAEKLTGYVVGGISPFGQKQRLATFVDETAVLYDTILVSGGRRGVDLEVAVGVLEHVLEATLGDIASS